MDLGTARTIQKIIENPSEKDSILATLDPAVQQEIRDQFRTNLKLKQLFPELAN